MVLYLLQLVEQLSDDADDPYHYSVIRVLVSTADHGASMLLLTSVACAERTVHVSS